MILQGLKKFAKDWGIRFGVLVMAALWLSFMAVSWAEASTEISDAPSRSDEYDFSWLDPEKKIYVLQNRRYLKAHHLALSAMIGSAASNPYRNALGFDGRVAYYLSESFGIEGFYTHFSNQENSTFEALRTSSGTAPLPVVREIRSQYGLMAQWVPWYAKINVFNSILYFDWYFNGGAGQLSTVRDVRTSGTAPASFSGTENLFGLFLGTGHQYHLGQNYSVRLDVTGAFYQAPVGGAAGDKIWFSNYVFGLGLVRRF